MTSNKKPNFKEALSNLLQGNYSEKDIYRLLNPKSKKEKEKTKKEAKKIKEKHFSNKVYLYGFLYFSTYCKNNCNFCYYRKENKHPTRYRKKPKDILKISRSLSKKEISLIDLTSGEDQYYKRNFDELLSIVKKVSEFGCVVMVSPGVLNENKLKKLHEAGADFYALYQETHSKNLYKSLRPQQPFKERKKARKKAKEIGLAVEDGILIGVGENRSELANSIYKMSKEKLTQVRCMPFVEHKGIPISKKDTNYDYGLITALLRLTNPKKLIPASLDINGEKGIKDPLNSGANVVTSIVPSSTGLAGVAQHEYGIESGERSPTHVTKFLRKNGYRIGSLKELKKTIQKNKCANLTHTNI
ncbi:MAG: (2R3R)-3-methylornithine synthase involved in pyrrolysine biosynthesis PylB [Candidatus Methanohalarchaeum thermophilum]|uniref:(2R3R)-3-methylornithine synthase involved in pyrrolysine biosynthesis PylB n=1 Tax=Methanohalarchaeum thermophilum TaxID=1903181 RepID=A0A1Q6DXK3_METT1|nr:MAG: (2R3R)-3-methylornithine synthase involved in pyrrolysine biosynthesis PylB [Candidatus Methanohalarchaeum thermophilum]